MTPDIALLLVIIGGAMSLFLTNALRVDVTALLVLSLLALSGLVSAEQALSGFSNPAVVAMWSMFVLSAGLTRAGIADVIGQWILRLGGRSEAGAVASLMLTGGVLSGFMNSIGVVALLLPVTVRLARRTAIPASRLLMPLACGTLLGGLTTLVATAPNLLVSAALRDAGHPPFGLFDFTPIGLTVLLAATAFVALGGRHLLPRTAPRDQTLSQQALREQYGLHERIFSLHVPRASRLIGATLDETALGRVAGLIVIALTRGAHTAALPPPQTVLAESDRLLVQGRRDRFIALRRWSGLDIEPETLHFGELLSDAVTLRELQISDRSRLIDSNLRQQAFRDRYAANILAIRRGEVVFRARLAERTLGAGDVLLAQCRRDGVPRLEKSPEFSAVNEVAPERVESTWKLQERLFTVRMQANSELEGVTLGESRLGDAFDFRLLAIWRRGGLLPMPEPTEVLQAGDLLILQGQEEDLEVLRRLQDFEVERDATPDLGVFDRGDLEVMEAVIHPHSQWVGELVGEANWRQRHQVELVAIWRAGRPHRSGLNTMRLAAGDALLFAGPTENLAGIATDANLIALNPVSTSPADHRKMPLAGSVMLAVILSVVAGWLPISIAALAGAVAMVLTGCLQMEDAYRAIDWRATFVIAGMLPLGIAIEQTGAAAAFADLALAPMAVHGPWAIVAGLYAMTAVGSVLVPNAVAVVLVSPIALSACAEFGIFPQSGMMAVAVAASASLMSPISHPANVLVMGPGNYRFVDYFKLGVPITLLNILIVALLFPWLWPVR